MSNENNSGRTGTSIVFVHCDSMDGRVMGCMDHPAAYTPNMDRLAERGVLFRNAYCNNPICCPSRASMWSGQYTHHCQGWNNHKGLEKNTRTFQTPLEKAGYRFQTYGKLDYLSGRHTHRARVTAWTRSANIALPAYQEHMPTVRPDDTSPMDIKDWTDVRRSVNYLKEDTKGDTPFLLYLGIRSPHPPFWTSQKWLDLIDPAKVTVPAKDRQVHPVMRYQKAVKNWSYGFSEEMVRKVRRIYFARIAEVDAMLGEVMNAVDQLDLSDTCYFIFSSDHGEMAMEHEQYYKSNMYEPSVRVPLIIAGPGVPKGAVVEDLVSLVDIYPTLMDMAGVTAATDLDGHSLMKKLTGAADDRPDWVLSEYHDSTLNTGCFMLRRGDYKYIAYVGYQPQLFDLKNDPDEIEDLAGIRTDVVRSMDAQLRTIVDYEAVDAEVKKYDRESFRQWRRGVEGGRIKPTGYGADRETVYPTYAEAIRSIYLGFGDEQEAQLNQWCSVSHEV